MCLNGLPSPIREVSKTLCLVSELPYFSLEDLGGFRKRPMSELWRGGRHTPTRVGSLILTKSLFIRINEYILVQLDLSYFCRRCATPVKLSDGEQSPRTIFTRKTSFRKTSFDRTTRLYVPSICVYLCKSFLCERTWEGGMTFPYKDYIIVYYP